MRVIAFTKPFGPVAPGALADRLAELEIAGADLVVREGQAVDPARPGGIVTFAEALAGNGMSLDVVTTDLLATGPVAEKILAACAEANVGLVRAGFYRYDPARGHRRCLEDARRGLGGLAELATQHGVRLAIQLHHGTLHASAAHALMVLNGLPDVAVYADPGNQTKEGGEDWRLNLDLLGDRLACLGVKNSAWHRGEDGWRCDWVPLKDGTISWREILAGLAERGFAGPFSLHVHYPTTDPVATLRAELDHLRSLSESDF